MKSSACESVQIKELSLEVANTFILQHDSSSQSYGAMPVALGLYSGEMLEGVLLVSTPLNYSAKAEYTREIVSLVFKDDSIPNENIKNLITEYMDRYHPYDLFIGEAFQNRFSSIYIDAGMERISDTEDSEVYLWSNPNYVFYCYKITSTKDSSYYIGQHSSIGRDLNIETLIADGYWGSGGVAFKEWANRVGKDNLLKEILGVYPTHRDTLLAENEFIGELYRTDPNCLNAKGGGPFPYSNTFDNRFCLEHGLTKHANGRCYKCRNNGDTHSGICPIHEIVELTKNVFCRRCLSENQLSLKDCEFHGLVHHRGTFCSTCVSRKSTTLENCVVHGDTSHQGGKCMACSRKALQNFQICPIHGNVLHVKDSCATCVAQKSIKLKICDLHGETLHKGTVCQTCFNNSQITIHQCEIHGKTKFQGNKCSKCSSMRSIKLKECAIHGETPFHGKRCVKCVADKTVTIRFCEKHGETRHRGTSCYKCDAVNIVSIEDCNIHGSVKMLHGKCYKCFTTSTFSVKECDKHGLVKHRKNSCFSCTAEKSARSRAEAKTKDQLDVDEYTRS